MPVLNARLLPVVMLLTGVGLATGNASAAETDADGALYEPSADPLADVQRAIAAAGAAERRALVVLGANWCIDSRALAARLHQPPLADVIEEHYELVLVDVGYLETDRAVAQELGVAHYYAMPTVLSVDPSSGQLVDVDEHHMWGNAYSVSMSESVEYFEKWALSDSAPDPASDSAQLEQLYARIDRFEGQLADRVDAGYAVVGPMLAAYYAGNAPPEFRASWSELRDFRMSIPGAIRELREEARRRAAAGEESIQLPFPEYPRLSWETGVTPSEGATRD